MEDILNVWADIYTIHTHGLTISHDCISTIVSYVPQDIDLYKVHLSKYSAKNKWDSFDSCAIKNISSSSNREKLSNRLMTYK